MERHALWSYSIYLPVNVSSASAARDFVVQHLADHELPHLTADVQLVVSELATNALTHAQTPFTVSLTAIERSVLLVVRDGAVARPLLGGRQGLEVGGRGMMIVEALSRDWGISAHADGGKSVWAEFATHRPRFLDEGSGATGVVTRSGSIDDRNHPA